MSQLSPILRATEGGGLWFRCPGCKEGHLIRHGDGPGPRWTWNGDALRPTFHPSVLVTREIWSPPVTPENLEQWRQAPWQQTKVAHICHSFVTDGRMQFLPDCTHELAGQTVDLPPLDLRSAGES